MRCYLFHDLGNNNHIRDRVLSSFTSKFDWVILFQFSLIEEFSTVKSVTFTSYLFFICNGLPSQPNVE